MNANHRSLASLGVMLVFGSLLVATSKASTDDGSRPKPTTTATTTAAQEPHQWPIASDVDTATLSTQGNCAAKPTHGFCRLLADFESAETWTDVPSAETFFYGESVGLGGEADNKREPFYATVGGTPLMAGAQSLVPENPKEQVDATKLLAAVKSGGPSGNSEAAKYMRATPLASGKRVLEKTSGKSHRFSRLPVNTYVRKKGTRILLIEWAGGTAIGHAAKTKSSSAIAYAAELWKLN